MKSRRCIYCMLSVFLSGMALFLFLTIFYPRAAEAKSKASYQPLAYTQGAGASLVVFPNPPQAHEPTEIRVILQNSGASEVVRYAQFYWSEFGVGQVRNPFDGRIAFVLPPNGEGTAFVTWIPPDIGPYCFYVEVYETPTSLMPLIALQHNVTFLAHPNPNNPHFTQGVPIPVHNPLPYPATFMFTMTFPADASLWDAIFDPVQVVIPGDGEFLVNAVFTYTGPGLLPPGGELIFMVNASVDGLPMGGVEIVFGPPIRLHMRAEPPYAESEISVNPYPIPPGEPAEICVEVRNVTHEVREAWVHFRVSPFGIGLPFEPIAPPVFIAIPELGMRRPCIQWVAPEGGQFAFEVFVETPGYPLNVSSLRVMDVNEILEPGIPSSLPFVVRNPFNVPVTITLGMIPSLDGWSLSLTQDVLPSMAQGEARVVTLTVTAPTGSPMPPDGSPVVDVEAFVGREPIGGFRKIYHPPVPIHRPGDPIYAEREITVNPYPPNEREPTQICVEIRNPTAEEQTVIVDFNVAEFGIGMPWHKINRPISTTLPAHSIKKICVTWVPPFGGRFGVEVGVQVTGHERIYSQRIIDVGEILLPNTPSIFEFMVRNPFPYSVTVTLGAIRYLPQWDVWFEPYTFRLNPGQIQPVIMHVLPVQQPGDPEPMEGEPVIDVEAFWERTGDHGLLGGFRKLFFPPIPIHREESPSYAENEIFISPYPPRAGEPTRLEFEARNPTTVTQVISVTFEWSSLGIGLPFTPIDGAQTITLHPGQVGVTGINWVPPVGGEFCVRIRAEAPFFSEPFYSSRNISIVRLPEPYGLPEVFQFVVGDGGNATRPLTITLGLKEYLPNWNVELKNNKIVLQTGQLLATGLMTITPPVNPNELPIDGGPIADVSAYVEGSLIGGIRKVWRPPVPLGQLGEASYAESEITINPDQPVAGQPATFSAQLRNNSDYPQTIDLQFGWADFGFGIVFTNTNIVPTQTVVTLNPHMTTTVSAQWTPTYSGYFCVQIHLTNHQTGEELHSQHNVDVIEVPETQCESFEQEFWLQNSTSSVVTVTIGVNAFNLPPGWTYSADPEEVVLMPYEGVTVTLTITPPCNLIAEGLLPYRTAFDIGDQTKIQVEGYDQTGELIGGIEIQLISVAQKRVYLPLIKR